MSPTKVKTIDDLPELPFEKLLSYLSVEDRLKSRAVAWRWYWKINSFKVNSLCCSGRPSGFIRRKSRLVSGAFVQNFISSTRFISFFATFGQSILSNLKHLRLCDLHLNEENGTAFVQILNSFDQLEELGLFRLVDQDTQRAGFELNLPMLTSIHLESLVGIWKPTLNAPRLQKVELVENVFLRLHLVHTESVERLFIDQLFPIPLENLKNLKYLYIGRSSFPFTNSPLPSGLNQLKEVHVIDNYWVLKFFEEKLRCGRTDLKIYLYGYLLIDRDDQLPSSYLDSLSDGESRKRRQKEAFVHLAKNPSRLADEIPFYDSLDYSAIERVHPDLAIDLMSRYTRLAKINASEPVQDVERFLNLLKNSGHIVELTFSGAQPQELFDRLPEHCAVQSLEINGTTSGFEFLFRLKHLNHLDVRCSVDAKLIRKLFKALEFLSCFEFEFENKRTAIRIALDLEWTHPKRFQVASGLGSDRKWTGVSDLNAAIRFVTGDSRPKKRKAEVLSSPRVTRASSRRQKIDPQSSVQQL